MDDTTWATRFLRDGFVKLQGAVAPRVAAHRARLLWRETGCDPHDPATSAQPPLVPAAPYELERADGAYSPVEIAIRRGPGRKPPGPDGTGTERSAGWTPFQRLGSGTSGGAAPAVTDQRGER
ncbi:hypothetical protein [Streptomyces syringium]|uniref:Uncharacterized protein n=1 Tax=Streptomyces syringium TaxID=76729 RepID=A0ABS4YE28_9ACTN|nr:hypothetical protein [Streptomyces syringium]